MGTAVAVAVVEGVVPEAGEGDGEAGEVGVGVGVLLVVV